MAKLSAIQMMVKLLNTTWCQETWLQCLTIHSCMIKLLRWLQVQAIATSRSHQITTCVSLQHLNNSMVPAFLDLLITSRLVLVMEEALSMVAIMFLQSMETTPAYQETSPWCSHQFTLPVWIMASTRFQELVMPQVLLTTVVVQCTLLLTPRKAQVMEAVLQEFQVACSQLQLD